MYGTEMNSPATAANAPPSGRREMKIFSLKKNACSVLSVANCLSYTNHYYICDTLENERRFDDTIK
jgi:hypothetical protein